MIDIKQYSEINLRKMLCEAKKINQFSLDDQKKEENLELIDSIENALLEKGVAANEIRMIGEIRISVGYIQIMDKSVIFETVFNENGEMKSEEIVGWYFGRPNEKDTKEFSNRNLKAEF